MRDAHYLDDDSSYRVVGENMIYADNAATTRISKSACEKMLPFLREQYGNASSQYKHGVNAKRAIGQARVLVASAIGATPDELYFTSGGTEANTWVLRGIFDAYRRDGIHIITSAIEHPSVLNTCRILEEMGAEVTYIPVSDSGLVSVGSVIAAIKSNTRLVSIMMANNEVGTIQPIAEIGCILQERRILFHTDAVQAVGHIPVDISELYVDFLTASAHKFYGAKGTGILYKRSGVELPSLLYGGGQEHGSRSGTENVASIVAAGCALNECVAEMDDTTKRVGTMATNTIAGIQANIPSVRVNGNSINRLPGIVNLGFDGVSGESMMHLLDLKGICVSTSSACNSGRENPSHVLLAMGQTVGQARSAIRVSYGRFNNIEDVKSIVCSIIESYKKITIINQS